MIGPS